LKRFCHLTHTIKSMKFKWVWLDWKVILCAFKHSFNIKHIRMQCNSHYLYLCVSKNEPNTDIFILFGFGLCYIFNIGFFVTHFPMIIQFCVRRHAFAPFFCFLLKWFSCHVNHSPLLRFLHGKRNWNVPVYIAVWQAYFILNNFYAIWNLPIIRIFYVDGAKNFQKFDQKSFVSLLVRRFLVSDRRLCQTAISKKSTFFDIDTLSERDSLIDTVFPKLKDYCREQYGLEFQASRNKFSLIFLNLCFTIHW
jgi:hypothetical protein